jgi:hypothetical protein
LDFGFFQLVQRKLCSGSVVELRCSRRFMVRDGLGVLSVPQFCGEVVMPVALKVWQQVE